MDPLAAIRETFFQECEEQLAELESGLLAAGDTSVDVPYRSDSHETGRIAATLEAFKQGLIEAIDERRRVEAANAALRESEARYRLLADNTSDIIVRFDLDGEVVYASPSVRRLGYRPEDMVGSIVGRRLHPDDRDQALALFADAAEGRPGRRGEWRIETADGRWLWFEGTPEPILDEAGVRIGILVVMRNIEDRKAAELELHEVNAELMRVARVSALGAFATSIAHEINQPLAAVVTNSEASMRWLARTPRDVEKAAEAINRAARDARRAADVVRRMRALVTKQEALHAEFDLNEAISEVMTLTQGEQRRLKIQTSLELCKGGPKIHGDRIQIQQVMLNLILNAIEAMREVPAKGRRLIVRTRSVEGGHVQVEVEDRGGGVDGPVAGRVFEHLFTTKVGGTGLGLAISKSIIDNHGGRIWVDAAPRRGAIFRFTVPDIRMGDRPATP